MISKKIYNYLLISFIIFLALVSFNNVSHAIILHEPCKLKADTIVRDETCSNIICILPSGAKVRYKGKKNENFIKISWFEDRTTKTNQKNRIEKTGYIKKDLIKEVNAKSWVNNVSTKDLKRLNNKEKIVKIAMEVNKKNIKYSTSLNRRNQLYFNFKNAKYADCASLCAGIYRRAFNLKSDKLVKSYNKNNVWTCKNYIENTKEKDGIFKEVKTITGDGGEIKIENLQIGDSVLMYKKGESAPSHIYMYIGDGQIIESIYSDGGLKGNKQLIERVIIRDLPSYFRKTTNKTGGGKWYKLTQIRPTDEYMLK